MSCNDSQCLLEPKGLKIDLKQEEKRYPVRVSGEPERLPNTNPKLLSKASGVVQCSGYLQTDERYGRMTCMIDEEGRRESP